MSIVRRSYTSSIRINHQLDCSKCLCLRYYAQWSWQPWSGPAGLCVLILGWRISWLELAARRDSGQLVVSASASPDTLATRLSTLDSQHSPRPAVAIKMQWHPDKETLASQHGDTHYQETETHLSQHHSPWTWLSVFTFSSYLYVAFKRLMIANSCFSLKDFIFQP